MENQEVRDKQNGFAGADRKVWLYLYRIKTHVTSDMILNFLKNKEEFDVSQVSAREIPSESGRLKRFVVTVPFSCKEAVYNPNFWPENVGIKRFDFKKHQGFLNNEGADFL